ncbi:MAG: M48 family metalloprotease [Spirochaetes bacterium]|nr:M48 family metalloprotease [Spirochaetota bacterium]
MLSTFFLLFTLTVFFLLVGRMVGGKRGMLVAFGLACILNFSAYWFSDTMVLAAYRAKPVAAGHRLERITHDLAMKAGIPVPSVHIIPSPSPNAFATGRNPDHAAVAATDGLLGMMGDREIAAVVAHELGHIHNRDTLVATMAATLSGGVLILSRMALFFGGGGSGWGKRIAVAVLAPAAATLVTLAISREREYEADAFSARLTGRPMDLARALLALERAVQRAPMPQHSPGTAHLFIVHPFSGVGMGRLFSTHPPVEKRVERLAAMRVEVRR